MVMFRKRQAAMKRRTEEGAVGGVDNAVDLESCNVPLAGVPTRSGVRMRHKDVVRGAHQLCRTMPAGIHMRASTGDTH